MRERETPSFAGTIWRNRVWTNHYDCVNRIGWQTMISGRHARSSLGEEFHVRQPSRAGSIEQNATFLNRNDRLED
jgi:hypothetical protein